MFKLKSNLEKILEIEDFVNTVTRKYNLSPSLQSNILISLTEAVNNAIRHGNLEDENKYVSIRLQHRPDKLIFWVKDEGCGFNPGDLPDPTLPENIQNPGGRGFYIMRHLCHHLSYKESGRVVEMQFKLD